MSDIANIQLEGNVYTLKDKGARNGHINIRHFESLSAVLSSTELVDGSIVQTLGYTQKGDGGSGYYIIREPETNEVTDGIITYSMTTGNLICEVLIDNFINVKSIGAIGDGTNDDTSVIQSAFNRLNDGVIKNNDGPVTVYFPAGNYKVTDTLTLTNLHNVNVRGNGALDATMNKPVLSITNCQYVVLEDLFIRNNNTTDSNSCTLRIENSYINEFNNLNLRGGHKCIYIYSGNNLVFNKCTVRNGRNNIFIDTRGNNTGNIFNSCAIEDPLDYNVYVNYAASYYGIYSFTGCYFEFDKFCAHLIQGQKIVFDSCFMNAMTNGAVFFENDSSYAFNNISNCVLINSRLMQNNVTAYLVKNLNDFVVGISIDENTTINSSIIAYNTNDSYVGLIGMTNPKRLNIYNADNMIIDSNNFPVDWAVQGTPNVTLENPASEESEHSIKLTGSGYFNKAVYLKANTMYKIIVKNRAITGAARFEIFNVELTSRLYRTDNANTTLTKTEVLFKVSDSGIYRFLFRNSDSSITSAFEGFELYQVTR